VLFDRATMPRIGGLTDAISGPIESALADATEVILSGCIVNIVKSKPRYLGMCLHSAFA